VLPEPGSVLLVIPILFFLSSCVSLHTYNVYAQNVRNGKDLLQEKKYGDAKKYFEEASKTKRDAGTLAYLAYIHSKINEIENAERLIKEAEQTTERDYSHLRLRTVGYKAIILLKKNKDEALDALKDYLHQYYYTFPLTSIGEVEKMWERRQADTDTLEELIEEQVSWHENELEQYWSTMTGITRRMVPAISRNRTLPLFVDAEIIFQRKEKS